MAIPIAWAEKIPDAIIELMSWAEGTLVDRQAVERLLGVDRRSAQRILKEADAKVEDNILILPVYDFCKYLEKKHGGELVRPERDRRRRFAEKFERMRQERIRGQSKPVFVDVLDCACQSVEYFGYAGLPESVKLGRGRLEFHFGSPLELAQQLALFASAMQGDGNGRDGIFPELERLTGTSSMEVRPAKESAPNGADLQSIRQSLESIKTQ